VHPDALSAPLLARCTFPPAGTSVVAGLSGGPDSTAMVGLAVAAGCRVTAIHVDHGLRSDSAAEVDLVVALAGVLGADVRTVRVDVVPGPNLEARARAARLAALGPAAMTGHTLDDQAETMLLRLVRGSGGRGLAAMRSGATKPILALRRWETRQWCEAVGLVPLLDPSNADPRHRRNRIRAEAIPLLDDLADRDVAPLLARTATLLGDDEALLEDLAAAIDPTAAAALVAAPLPLARRAVRAWLARDGYPPDAATVERVLAVARGDAVATEVGGGASVRRSAGRLSRVDATS
jgi:tRNA(Ile)-lysidine synthase